LTGFDDQVRSDVDQPSRRPERVDGFAPLRAYAAIGDGRTVALVALDGSIDWLPTPSTDSPTVFARLLDSGRGGCFELSPEGDAEVARRYVGGTAVLETIFSTRTGTVRVTDAMTIPAGGLPPFREVVRKVQCIAGTVAMRWSVRPRFGYATRRTRFGWRAGVPVADSGGDAIAVRSFDAGEPCVDGDEISGRFDIDEGEFAIVSVALAHQEPLVFSGRAEVEDRLAATIAAWKGWSGGRTTGPSSSVPWSDAVERSALTLKLLFHAPSGAIVAAPTTSLPEVLGGARNWDYRYCWIRDSAFTLDALLHLGCSAEADAFFWWLMQASQRTHPRLQVLYGLDGGAEAKERVLELQGYRGSTPVRVGNGAVDQVQLDIYGDLLEAAWEYTRAGRSFDAEIAGRLAGAADRVAAIWREPDAGIWEVRSEPRHFTHSKMMCWVALDRALRMAEDGALPDRRAGAWRRAREEVEGFIWSECWSQPMGTLVRSPGSQDLDAALLLGAHFGFDEGGNRLSRTVEAIRRGLGHGPFVYRYSGEDGLEGREGAFLPCSFWLVEALARSGRLDEASALMEELMALSNDLGLYSEEIDPQTGEFLGNFPQGLTHLALLQAAFALEEAKS
jgi:GH15 family glucan-1,4-alpha-glucosidase